MTGAAASGAASAMGAPASGAASAVGKPTSAVLQNLRRRATAIQQRFQHRGLLWKCRRVQTLLATWVELLSVDTNCKSVVVQTEKKHMRAPIIVHYIVLYFVLYYYY